MSHEAPGPKVYVKDGITTIIPGYDHRVAKHPDPRLSPYTKDPAADEKGRKKVDISGTPGFDPRVQHHSNPYLSPYAHDPHASAGENGGSKF